MLGSKALWRGISAWQSSVCARTTLNGVLFEQPTVISTPLRRALRPQSEQGVSDVASEKIPKFLDLPGNLPTNRVEDASSSSEQTLWAMLAKSQLKLTPAIILTGRKPITLLQSISAKGVTGIVPEICPAWHE